MNSAANYLAYWRLRNLSCPGHFKEAEVRRRIDAWIEMSIWWGKIKQYSLSDILERSIIL